MRHRNTIKKFDMRKSQRVAMFRNMLTSLIMKEKVFTTKEKGGVLKKIADKVIHKAKTKGINVRRDISKYVPAENAQKKLIDVIAPRFMTRNGGYTRKVLAYRRFGDAAEMCYVMLCDEKPAAAPAGDKKSS
ncbi:MAG: 50S ribosomal protein L17 [Spirochaetota bacterium]